MTVDYEFILRAGAVLAAVALVAVPRLVDVAKAAAQGLWSAKAPQSGYEVKDSHFVLDIARRLKAEGNLAGVALCQQLIDAMLNPKEPKK